MRWRAGVEHFIVAGDLVTGGPQPVESLGLLRSLNAWMIRGNADNYLLALADGSASAGMRSAAQWALTRWSFHRLPRAELEFIAGLPDEHVVALPDVAAIRVVHGAPGSSSRFLLPDRQPDRMVHFRRGAMLGATLPADRQPAPLAAELAAVAERLLICGHSHISWQQAEDGKLAVNPGGVDGGLEGDALAHYALLTWREDEWQAELRGIPYDLARSRAAFQDTGLLAEGGPLARAFLLSGETGENVGYFLVLHAYRLAAAAGCSVNDVVPDEIWEEAARSFDWKRWNRMD